MTRGESTAITVAESISENPLDERCVTGDMKTFVKIHSQQSDTSETSRTTGGLTIYVYACTIGVYVAKRPTGCGLWSSPVASDDSPQKRNGAETESPSASKRAADAAT